MRSCALCFQSVLHIAVACIATLHTYAAYLQVVLLQTLYHGNAFHPACTALHNGTRHQALAARAATTATSIHLTEPNCRRMIWANGSLAAGAGFRSISMHALSRDSEFYHKPCIYCQLDDPTELAGAGADDNVASHEVMLVPQDADAGAVPACCGRTRFACLALF